MYFSIDYKFIFFYEASLLSGEVGGGSNPLGGQSLSGSMLREGGDIYSPKGQSTDGHVGSQQGQSGSQQSQGGQDASQPHQGGHQFEYCFHLICTNLLTCVFLIYKILYIDAEAEILLKKDVGKNASFKKKVVH